MPNFESWLNTHLRLRANGYQTGEGQDHLSNVIDIFSYMWLFK